MLIQHSIVNPKLEWRMSLVKQSVDRDSSHLNPLAAWTNRMSRTSAKTGRFDREPGVDTDDHARKDPEMACFTCHLSWATSIGGCHPPIEANWKTGSHRYDGIETRNFATRNPQIARDEMLRLGRHQTIKGDRIKPIRSTSALVLSSTNIDRERIHSRQPPIPAPEFFSQAFASHFPHAVRKTETKTCPDCHLSACDGNAIISQPLPGTNSVNFLGFQAIRLIEW